MLGKECVPFFPTATTRNNSDDRVVLAVGERFHILHCKNAVTVYHSHNSPTKVTNNPKAVFEGVYRLVRDYRAKIVQVHGAKLFLLWRLRVFKAFVRYQIVASSAIIAGSPSTFVGQCQSGVLRFYRMGLRCLHFALRRFLKRYFQHDYF
jgi:hypothetical protein